MIAPVAEMPKGALSLDDALKAVDAIGDTAKSEVKAVAELQKILARQLGCDPHHMDLMGFARQAKDLHPGKNYGKPVWDLREVKRIARDYIKWVDEYGGEISLKGGIVECQGGFGACGYGKVHYWEAWGEGPKLHSRVSLNGRIMTDSYRRKGCNPTAFIKSTNNAAGTEIHEFTHAVQGARWYEVKSAGGGVYTAQESKEGIRILDQTRRFKWKMKKRPHIAKYFSDYGSDLPIEVHTEIAAALRYPQGWVNRFGYVDFLEIHRYRTGGGEYMIKWLQGHAEYAKRFAGKDLDTWLKARSITPTLEKAFMDRLGWDDDLLDAIANAYGSWLWETKWSRVYYGALRKAHLISGNETFVPAGMNRFGSAWRPASYRGTE